MLKKMTVVMCAAAMLVLASPLQAGDGCAGCKKVSDSGQGFCCGKGKAYGVDMTSQKLFDALEGHKVESADAIKCGGCKEAVAKDGTCDHCKVGSVANTLYHSMVAYRLAKGAYLSADKAPTCDACKVANADNGFCSGCSVGFVANRLHKDKESYTAALASFKTLTKASKTAEKCELCAVAMVTDGACDACKVSFKDGNPVTAEKGS